MIATLKTFAKQRQALRLLRDQQTNEVMYGGGARGGKSWIGNAWILMAAISMPGSAWLVAREELTKLKDTTLLTYFKVANALGAKGEYTYNGTSNTATFHNGSVVFFREIKWIPSDPEFDRLGSYDLTGAFIDEAQQIHPKAISVLRGRFSLLSGEVDEETGLPVWRTVPKMLFTCNPSKNWIYTDFYKPSVEGSLEPHKAFVVSLATDNPFVSEAYLTNLRRSDAVTVARLLDGNFEYDDDPTVLVGYDAISQLLLNDTVAAGRHCLTVDVARFGSDTTVIYRWQGFRMLERTVLKNYAVPEVAEAVKLKMRQHRVLPTNTVVDDDGVGGGVVDLIPGCVPFVAQSVPLADPAAAKVRNLKTGKLEPPKENYDNLKSQCAFRMSARMVRGEVFVYPDAVGMDWDRIAEELAQWKRLKPDSDGKLRLVPKATMKAALGRSPDDGDNFLMREMLELAAPNYKRRGAKSSLI
jgi:phage terminase large subunit